jgi:hypothetical protein
VQRAPDKLAGAARIRTEGGRFLALARQYIVDLRNLLRAGFVVRADCYAIVRIGHRTGVRKWAGFPSIRASNGGVCPALLLQYSFTAGLLEVLTRYGSLGERVALAIAIVVVIPLSFFLSRRLLRGESVGPL